MIALSARRWYWPNASASKLMKAHAAKLLARLRFCGIMLSAMYKEQYVRYLETIYRKHDGSSISSSTVDHYADESIRKIDQLINKYSLADINSIYEIDSLSKLEQIKKLLKLNPEFKQLDSDGHNMYSAGLNRYMDFAEGRNFQTIKSDIERLDQPLPAKDTIKTKGYSVQNRDRITIIQAEEASGYLCQVNQSHETFIAASTQNPFVEGHHIIPLQFQNEFKYSLDVYANILVLCPNCHRLFHYGDLEKSDRVMLLKKVFDQRQPRLEKSGIELSRNDFLELALAKRKEEKPNY